jgi:hypothetical protein
MVLENFGLNFMTSMQLFTNFGILRQFLAFKEYENLKEKIKSATQRVLAREPTGNGPHGLPDPAAGFFSSPTDADELGPRGVDAMARPSRLHRQRGSKPRPPQAWGRRNGSILQYKGHETHQNHPAVIAPLAAKGTAAQERSSDRGGGFLHRKATG